MIVSLNEVQATAQKAASGCGQPFGLAEEMGYATRWLCERGLRGTEKLLHALEQSLVPILRVAESNDAITLSSDGEVASVVSLGPSLADYVLLAKTQNKKVLIPAISHPLLLLPFVAQAGLRPGTLSVGWKTIDDESVAIVVANGDMTVFARDALSLIQARAFDVRCEWKQQETNLPTLYTAKQLAENKAERVEHGCTVPGPVWEKISAHAHNTYVPISDASRLSGAGAGLTDND
ncbi:MAG: DUF3726 domain-containing protein [Pseudomonadota bacterium]